MLGGFVHMSEKLDVKGKSINEIMRWYYDDCIVINRRYQRKLVWTLEENRLFIDSLINKFPTPSIIVSEYQDDDGKSMYEVIDGLQRLNAIVRFVNNEYGIIIDGEERFYDTQFTPSANRKKLDGELIQKKNMLSYTICEQFSEEPIPVVITAQRDDRSEKIEQIFGRINSSRRKLSAHDIRQASCISDFADCVRRLSTIVRGDYTYYDMINLCDMPKISLDGTGLNYGINPNEVFWRRHDIFPLNNFKQSKDEELIASILTICLLGKKYLKINSDILNNLYSDSKQIALDVNEKIQNIGKERIEEKFKFIFDEIDRIFDSVNSTFTKYLYEKKDMGGKDISFILLFCAIYELNNEHYYIKNYKPVAKLLKNYYNNVFLSISKNSSSKNRLNVYDILYNALKTIMKKELPKEKTSDEKLIEKLLSLSSCESQMVEFKIGLLDFENQNWNNNEIKKIGKTLVAMSNTDCNYQKDGYVIIGVANNKDSAMDWESVYNKKSIKYGKHYVVGIESEATKKYSDIDEYIRIFTEKISKQPIDETVKKHVLSNCRIVNFYGKELFILPIIYTDEICKYDNIPYTREFSKTKVIKNKDTD